MAVRLKVQSGPDTTLSFEVGLAGVREIGSGDDWVTVIYDDGHERVFPWSRVYEMEVASHET